MTPATLPFVSTLEYPTEFAPGGGSLVVSSGLMGILRCPQHPKEGELEEKAGSLKCRSCGSSYPVVEGIPVMLDRDRAADPYLAAEQLQWDTQTDHYDATRATDHVYLAGVNCAVANLAVRPGELILDAACGTGQTIRQYHRPGLRTVGLDLSLQSLLYLKRKLPESSGVDLVCGDLTAMPFAHRVFTKVLCANALQHLPDAEGRNWAVGELARVSTPGARVVVTVHNFSRVKERAGWTKEGKSGGSSGDVQWIYRFVADEFETMLAATLQVRKVTGAGLPLWYRFKLTPIMKVVERLAWNFRMTTRWSHMLVGVGQAV
jgi:SAM-dependent methyltransferase